MAIGRKHQADNLTQVAHDVILYILSKHDSPEAMQAHRDELVDIFQDAKEAYNKPQHSYFNFIAWVETNIIYPFSRRRSQELIAAQGAVLSSEHNEIMLILDVFCKVLNMGRCESTSFNTHLIDLLVAKTGKYQPLAEDEQIQALGWGNVSGAVMTCHEKIREKVVAEAQVILLDHDRQLNEREKAKLQPEAQNVNRLSVRPSFLEELSKKITGKSLSGDSIHENPQVLQRPEKVNMIENYKPVNFALMHQKLANRYAELSQKVNQDDDLIIPKGFFDENTTAVAEPIKPHRKTKKLTETYPDRLKTIGAFFNERKQPEVEQQEAELKPGL